MEFSTFKEDIDELIQEFDQGGCTTLADMKRIWLSRKFTYIFEARPSKNVPLFMQSLYSHCTDHMIDSYTLSHRLGGLYCLYCLYETQPFKPPFKVYLSLGELRRLKFLVIYAKEKGVKAAVSIVRRMLEKNAFLFGFVDIMEYADSDNVKKALKKREASLKNLYDKLLAGKDMGAVVKDMFTELEVDAVEKFSREYEQARVLAIRGADPEADAQHSSIIADLRTSFAAEVRKIADEWDNQKDILNQQYSGAIRPAIENCAREDDFQPMVLQHPEHDDIEPTGFMQLLFGDEEMHLDNLDFHPSEIRQHQGIEDNRD